MRFINRQPGSGGRWLLALLPLLALLTLLTLPTIIIASRAALKAVPPSIREAALGIARTFQGGRLFRDLAVIDNLEVTGVGLGQSRAQARAEAVAMLDWIGIPALQNRIAGTLPYTDERRVAIGRALIGKPDYILLDEPAAGMSGAEAADYQRLEFLGDRVLGLVIASELFTRFPKASEGEMSSRLHVLASGATCAATSCMQ